MDSCFSPMGIKAKWNANNLIQILNLTHRINFLSNDNDNTIRALEIIIKLNLE